MADNRYSGDPPAEERRERLRGLPIMVGDVVVHSDILTEYFLCDLPLCHGRCCEEGDAGAPVTVEEIARIEASLDDIWPKLSAAAQAEIDRRGVAYPDPEGELVTTIVNGRDCAFRGPQGCLLSPRPLSCHLYPIRARRTGSYVALTYHRWDICEAARRRGLREGVRVYEFLREPLVRCFGQGWYAELELTAKQMREQGIL